MRSHPKNDLPTTAAQRKPGYGLIGQACAVLCMGWWAATCSAQSVSSAPSPSTDSAATTAKPAEPKLVGLARPQRADRTRLVVFQSRELPAAPKPINVYVNSEYQATSLGHTYTVVDVCTGPSRLGTAVGDARQAYKNKPVAGDIIELLPGATQYLQLIADEAGQRLVPVSLDEGKREINGLPLQSHTLSRVDPNKCAPLTPAAPQAAVPVPVPAEPPTPAPVSPPPAEPTVMASYRLSAQSLFAFDRSDTAAMSPEGRVQIQQIAADILSKKSAGTVKVVGHTDPFGTPEYNARLSQARAQTVADELVRAGVPRERILAEGRGALALLKTDCTGTREQQIVCHQPNRRVDIDVLESDSALAIPLAAAQAGAEGAPAEKLFLTFDSGGYATGALRLGLGARNNDLTGHHDVLTAQISVAPSQVAKTQVAALTYTLPVPSLNSQFSVYTAHSNDPAGTQQNLFDFNGKGVAAGLGWQYNLPDMAGLKWSLNAAYDWREYRNDGSLGTSTTLPDKLRVFVLTTGLQARSEQAFGGFGAVRASLRYGGNTGGGSEQAVFTAARSSARKNYKVWLYNFDVTLRAHQDLASWGGRMALSGMQSSDALVYGEQFGLGGMNSVRGYREREFSADRGYALRTELFTANLKSQLPAYLQSFTQDTRLKVFTDIGKGWRNQAVAGQPDTVNPSAAGVGLQWTSLNRWNLNIDVARVMQTLGSRSDGDISGRFRLFKAF